MTTPAPISAQPLLRTVPYLTVAEFRAMPTYLDSDDLVTTGNTVAAAQDAELLNELLRASAWIDSYCDQPLAGHLWSEQVLLRATRQGEFRFHADHQPIRQLKSFAYGSGQTGLVTLSDLSNVQYRNGTQVTVPLSGSGSFFGALQFGGIVAPGSEQLCEFSYTAGYATTTISAPGVAAGAISIPVDDATAIHPGDVLRIWDPSKEEAVTVTAVVGNTLTVPPLKNAHSTGAGISCLPPDVKRATAIITISSLSRPSTGEDPFADAPVSRTGRKLDPRKRGSGMLDRVEKMLRSYRRVWA